jgi:exopolyphosphatase/guanosine-5'-triphosphate,3'-diphosphate pyrophosphatase
MRHTPLSPLGSSDWQALLSAPLGPQVIPMTVRPVHDPSLLHGVIDLGTHSCLLLVGRKTDQGGLEVATDLCEIPRLGEGLAKTGRLSEAGMQRTLAVLEKFKREAQRLGVATLIVGGTAAMRRAANADDMVGRVRDSLGLELLVIGEDEEAELAWAAATAAQDVRDALRVGRQVCVVDVGGGSTEVVVDGGRRVCSFPLGGVVLTEQFGTAGGLGSDQSRLENWGNLEKAVGVGFLELGAWLGNGGTNRVLGSSRLDSGGAAAPLLVAMGGTACNLGALVLDLERFDHMAAEGLHLPASAVREWSTRLGPLSLQSRNEYPIESTRASVLPAGLACLGEAVRIIGATELFVTGRGLRFGLIHTRLGTG